MADIVGFPSPLVANPQAVLDAAKDEGLDEVLVIGLRPGAQRDGDVVALSSTGDGRQVLWLLQKLSHKLLSGDFDDG